MTLLQSLIALAKKTPLHPQWLLHATQQADIDDLKKVDGLVLDIGSADQWVKRHLASDCHYIALDYPQTGLNLYKQTPNILANASTLPVQANTVDAVLMMDVIEHLREPYQALQESFRVLKPKGKLLVTIPFLYPIHDAPHDYQRYTLHGIKRDFENCGYLLEPICENMGCLESGGLLLCLALGGSLYQAWRKRSAWILAAPIYLISIGCINMTCWLAGKILPSWPALTAGYRFIAIKP
jgi:SAM-dependent methyltransferase